MNLVEKIDLSFASVALYDPPLIKVEVYGDVVISEPEARLITDHIGKLSGGKEFRVLLMSDEMVQFDGSARDYSASPDGTRFSVAEAFVVKNMAQKLIASFYLNFNKPKKPTRAFDKEEEAVEWLMSFPLPL